MNSEDVFVLFESPASDLAVQQLNRWDTILFQVGLVRRDLDFIKINGIGARKYRIPRSPSLSALDDVKKQSEEKNNTYRKGEVPK